MYCMTYQAARPTRFSRKVSGGGRVWRTEFFGPPPSPSSSDSIDPAALNELRYDEPGPGESRPPQAFLVEQEPDTTAAPHFHFVDQFQVFIEGGGRLGAHPVQPVAVHFAAACTGYGPIVPGETGLSYFTLRASADTTGAQYLPASRSKLKKLPKQHVTTGPIIPLHADELRVLSDAKSITVHESENGLAIRHVQSPPGGQIKASTLLSDAAVGVSVLVLEGSISAGGQRLDRWSALYLNAGEEAQTFSTGPSGAEVLVLQYPSPHSVAALA